MARKPPRPSLGGIDATDDLDRIREYGLRKGFLPTDPVEVARPAPQPAPRPATTPDPRPEPRPEPRAEPQPPPAAAAPPPVPAPVILRPTPTRPWQAMFPDYLMDELRQAAAREGTAQKVVVLKALRQAGFRVDDIDLQDLRRR